MARSEQERQKDKTKRHGVVTKVVLFFFALPITILVTMVISILVEWGLIFHCNDGPGTAVCSFAEFEKGMGAEHSRVMLSQEAKYLNKHFKESLMGSGPVMVAGNAISWVDENIFDPIGMEGYKKKSAQERSTLWKYWVASYTMVKVVIMRLIVIFLSVPSYLLFGVVGLVTGLVERELRKWGAGRESKDRFEISIHLIAPAIILCFVLYLSWPSSINPALIIVPFAAMFGLALHLTASNYKKYF